MGSISVTHTWALSARSAWAALHDAREKLKVWQDDYNHHRPHSSLGNLTPSEFVNRRSVQPNEAASL